jgi:hypothetical protein
MQKTVLVMLMRHRRESALKVQKLLTDFGCIVKTRLGIHDGVSDKCSDTGLIILELFGKAKDKATLAAKLNKVPGVKVKTVGISL